MVITTYAECGKCHTRVIYPETPTGQRLPPVNFWPDPAGDMAVWQSDTGTWLGRFLAADEAPSVPAKRFGRHECQVTAELPGALLLWPSQARHH